MYSIITEGQVVGHHDLAAVGLDELVVDRRHRRQGPGDQRAVDVGVVLAAPRRLGDQGLVLG
jgi:hypothetical protein